MRRIRPAPGPRGKLDHPRDVGGLRRTDGHWLWIGGPVPTGSAAITLGSLVIVRRRAAESPGYAELLAHERVHVEQWRALGIIRFVRNYAGAYVGGRWRGYGHVGAYRRIPLEVHARVAARDQVNPPPFVRTAELTPR